MSPGRLLGACGRADILILPGVRAVTLGDAGTVPRPFRAFRASG